MSQALALFTLGVYSAVTGCRMAHLLAVLVFGHPAPLFFVLTAVAYPIWRARALRRDPAAV